MLKTKGWGPWKYEWYSVCSAHQNPHDNCVCCQAGDWQNSYKQYIISYIYERNYNIWFKWANDPKMPGIIVLIMHYLYEKVRFR